MSTPSSVRVHDDLTARQTSIALNPSQKINFFVDYSETQGLRAKSNAIFLEE
jgi:hypothetical protein